MIQKMSDERLWSQIVARAWSDEEFKQRLLADPRAVLAENGLEVPEDIEVQMLEDTPTTRTFVLPPPPTDELSDEELVGSATADSFSYFCGRCGDCGCGCRRCRCRC
jgi:hypothetical protein